MTYNQSRTCGGCGSTESRDLEKMDAAFEERREWVAPCGACGALQFSSSGCSWPDLDADILEAWIHNDDLNLTQQDEDLIMAGRENLPLLKRFIQRRDARPTKRAILLSALCVIIHDNQPDPDDADNEFDPVAANDAAGFLASNRHMFDEIETSLIYDYVKEVAFAVIQDLVDDEHCGGLR